MKDLQCLIIDVIYYFCFDNESYEVVEITLNWDCIINTKRKTLLQNILSLDLEIYCLIKQLGISGILKLAMMNYEVVVPMILLTVPQEIVGEISLCWTRNTADNYRSNLIPAHRASRKNWYSWRIILHTPNNETGLSTEAPRTKNFYCIYLFYEKHFST